jgi:alanyl-tRNA synthetase
VITNLPFFFFFCLMKDASHVAKTGDIKAFVITEESGIAKGIRRIVAVTGHEAHEGARVAAALRARLEAIERMEGKEKDLALKAFTTELGQSEMSVIIKAELRERSGAIRKAFDKQMKEKEASANKMASYP